MLRLIPGKSLVLLLLLLGSAAGGAYAYHRYRDADWERRESEYQRQLQGKLTESEQQMQALNTQLGVARAQLVTQGSLDEKYQALLTARDADFEKFRREPLKTGDEVKLTTPRGTTTYEIRGVEYR